MIKIRTTFEIVTRESAEYGDVAESGWIDEEGTDYTFTELVELLGCCEPSSSACHPGMWATDYEYGKGSRAYFEQGEEETRSYHPVSDRDSRYFNKAIEYIKNQARATMAFKM